MGDFFSPLFGNQRTKERLSSAIRSGTVSHGYIISGPPLSGKRTLARLFAAALNCTSDMRGTFPCLKCRNCERIMNDDHPDVKFVRRKEGRATLGIDDVRDMRRDAYLSATESEHRIYIFENAETMTAAAQNSILKILEEPPDGVVMLLLTESSDALLPTVRSRSQQIGMQIFSPDDIEKYLISAGYDPGDKLREAAVAGGGRIGESLRLLDDENGAAVRKERACVAAVAAAMRRGAPYSEILSAVGALPQERTALNEALMMLASAVRDLSVSLVAASAEMSFYTDREEACRIAASIGAKRLSAIYRMLEDILSSGKKNANITAMLSSLALEIRTAAQD